VVGSDTRKLQPDLVSILPMPAAFGANQSATFSTDCPEAHYSERIRGAASLQHCDLSTMGSLRHDAASIATGPRSTLININSDPTAPRRTVSIPLLRALDAGQGKHRYPGIINDRGERKSLKVGMFEHILIATDGSELANRAIHQGLALAEARKARATAVTVTRRDACQAARVVTLRPVPRGIKRPRSAQRLSRCRRSNGSAYYRKKRSVGAESVTHMALTHEPWATELEKTAGLAGPINSRPKRS
jgi:nucleotide-binding universal stress UspA family protein